MAMAPRKREQEGAGFRKLRVVVTAERVVVLHTGLKVVVESDNELEVAEMVGVENGIELVVVGIGKWEVEGMGMGVASK